MTRTRRAAFWAAVGVLAIGHVDVAWWPSGPPGGLVAGWIPVDLAYHLIWIVAASAVVFVMAGPMWEHEP